MIREGPKILLFDIENAPNLLYGWDLYETDAIKVVKHAYLLSFAYKWLGEDKIYVRALPDYSQYKRNKESDEQLVKELWQILNQADVICGHNSDNFDLKKANSRFIFYGLDPPSPYKTIDTLKLARQIGYFGSNKLDSLAQYLRIGRKLSHTGKDLWFGCMQGNKKDWALMKKYNIHDVSLTEEVYYKLRPYAKNHPDLRVYDQSLGCPVCRSTKVQKRGKKVKGARIYQHYWCRSCGKWFSGDMIKEL